VLAGHVVVSETLQAVDVRLPELLDVVLVIAWVGAGVWAQVYRYRRVSTAAQRLQTKWVAAALVTALIGFVVTSGLGALPVSARPGAAVVFAGMQLLVDGGFFCLVPLAIARAVLRHRLWDIDPILNRAVVFGGLTVVLTGVYALVVGWLGRAAALEGLSWASFAAAVVVAVLFEPARRRLQRWANRLTYGQRDDPYAAVTELAQRLENTIALDAVLPTLVASVRTAVRSPFAAVAGADGTTLAASGRTASEVTRVPLVQHGEHIGTLLVAPRALGETFDTRDDRLLTDLARQAGAALHAVQLHRRTIRLATDLQASRERLVTAREEERRRVRRDLHDGIGPTLAAQAMQIEAAHDLLRTRPTDAEALLKEALARATDAVTEVRRIAHGLRPPALDDLGLVGAVRQAAGQLSNQACIQINADPLPPLPAAVEAAAYAIVREALTNVVRHAHSNTAAVELAIEAHALRVRVRDHGRGPDPRPVTGVGTVSMRERAEELGGTCTVTAAPGGGTLVAAALPLSI
jgi:signal transduction histidine kinase